MQSRPHSRVRASDSAVCSSVPASTGGGATQRSSGGGSGQTTTVSCWTVARRDAQAAEQHGDAEGEPPHIFSSAVRSGSGIRQPAAQSPSARGAALGLHHARGLMDDLAQLLEIGLGATGRPAVCRPQGELHGARGVDWLKEPLRNAFQAHFSKRYTYEDLREEALNPRQKSLFDEEEPEPSCFCD